MLTRESRRHGVGDPSIVCVVGERAAQQRLGLIVQILIAAARHLPLQPAEILQEEKNEF